MTTSFLGLQQGRDIGGEGLPRFRAADGLAVDGDRRRFWHAVAHQPDVLVRVHDAWSAKPGVASRPGVERNLPRRTETNTVHGERPAGRRSLEQLVRVQSLPKTEL